MASASMSFFAGASASYTTCMQHITNRNHLKSSIIRPQNLLTVNFSVIMLTSSVLFI